MKLQDLNERTLKFSTNILQFIESLPDTRICGIISNQLLRSASSVGANYRSAGRAKSTRDFINKLKIVEEECDESLYWLQLLSKQNLGNPDNLSLLITEADELVAIFVTSINTAKANLELQRKRKTSTF